MMALALDLVGQPVQPYLTTGATDFVNSVQKGKEDAIRTEELKTQSQKSALDLLTAQKKAKDEQWYSDNAGALSRKVKTLDVADEDLAKMAQVNPEYHKVLQSERADAVKNFNASNLAYLTMSTDKAKSMQEIIQASEAHGLPVPDQFKQSPEAFQQYLRILHAGANANDLKSVTKEDNGDITTRDMSGTPIEIKAGTKTDKTQKAPVTWTVGEGRKEITYGYDANGKQVVLGTKNLDAPKSEEQPKQPRLQQVTNENGTFLLNIDTGEVKPVIIGGKQLQPVKPAQTPSGEESKSAGYAFRMGEANKILTDFETNKKGMPSYATSMAGSVPIIGDYLERKVQDQNQQLYKNAALAWLRAKLRDESGATIQNLESNNEYKTYFPLVGDEPETIKQKAKLREIAEAEMMLKAGKASTKLEQTRKDYNAKNPPAKNAQGWTLHTDKYGNKAYVSPDGKQYQKVQ